MSLITKAIIILLIVAVSLGVIYNYEPEDNNNQLLEDDDCEYPEGKLLVIGYCKMQSTPSEIMDYWRNRDG